MLERLDSFRLSSVIRSGGSVRRRAFTLVELLAVVAIVTVLAAILLPALTAAKQSALSVKCKSNLRQIGLALTMYVSEFSTYPFWLAPNNTSPAPSDSAWPNLLEPYLQKRAQAADVGPVANRSASEGGAETTFNCPVKGPTFGQWAGGGGGFVRTDYGYNMYGFRDSVAVEAFLGLWGRRTQAGGGNYFCPTRESDVASPADMIAFGDGTANLRRGKVGAFGGTFYRTEQDYFLADDGVYLQTLLGFARKRHGGRANVAFCDGHVEQGSLKRLFLDLDNGALRRWNKDSQGHH